LAPDPRVIYDAERVVLDMIRYHRPPGQFIVFDVGANVGDYTHEVFKRDRFVAVTAFEPQPEAARVIHKRFPRVTVENFALGIKDSEIELHRDTPSSYHASTYRKQHHILGTFMDVISTNQYRLDTYCNARMISQIDLLKIDVEGAEMDVLQGAGSMLAKGSIKLIQFEYNDNAELANTSFLDFWIFLGRRNFRLYREHDKFVEPINSYDEADENHYPGRNYRAVHNSVDWWPY
jgi:FkbM family methyltransferase